MRNSYNIFDYYLVNSDVHRLNSVCKIISMLLFVFCVIIADSVIDLFVINLFLFVLMIWSNVSFRFWILNIGLFFVPVMILGIIFGIMFWDVNVGLGTFFKVFDVVFFVSLIAMTTSFLDLVYGIKKVIKPFSYFGDVMQVALSLGMGVKFLSLIYVYKERISNSLLLKGGRGVDMSLLDRSRVFFDSFFSVFRCAYNEMLGFKRVMYIKNYGVIGDSANYRLNKWKKTDTILLVINGIVMIVTFIY